MKCYHDATERAPKVFAYFLGEPKGPSWREVPPQPKEMIECYGSNDKDLGGIWHEDGTWSWYYYFEIYRTGDFDELSRVVHRVSDLFVTKRESRNFYKSTTKVCGISAVEGRWWRDVSAVYFELESDYLACEMSR